VSARRPLRVSASAPLAEGIKSLAALRAKAEDCRACPLFASATQTVFSEGTKTAEIFLIGEQPGDEEDVEGRPFVGPAGRKLDELLEEAGIDRSTLYLTNAVKHFKWTPAPRGRKRLHSRPVGKEIGACRGWLDAELRIVKPVAVVCLGAVAAQGFLGTSYRITEQRGEIDETTPWAPLFMSTFHPSAILRAPDLLTRLATQDAVVTDLRNIARAVESRRRASA
jgi:uracil-DNA glycosylase family protein